MKKHIPLLILFFLCCNARSQTLLYEDMQPDSLQKWMNERIGNAKKGKYEMVEMPFVVRSIGWGCKCPMHYIGVSPAMGEGPWIWPQKPKGFPQGGENGLSLVVTGYFTGKWITEDLRDKDGEPEEWLYKMPEFKIVSWKKNELGYQVPAPDLVKKKAEPLKKKK